MIDVKRRREVSGFGNILIKEWPALLACFPHTRIRHDCRDQATAHEQTLSDFQASRYRLEMILCSAF